MPKSVPADSQFAVKVAIGAAFVLTGLQVASKSLRDGLFCAVFEAKDLPRVMALGACLAFAVALVVGRIMPRIGPRRTAILLLLLNAVALIGERLLVTGAPRMAAVAVYLHTAAMAGAIVSGFWSLVSERLNPHTMRVATPRIGLGATLGGLSGGLFAERVVPLLGTAHALLLLCGLSLASAGLLQTLKTRKAQQRAPETAIAPLGKSASSYLRSVALLVGCTALCSSIADFALKARAMERYEGVNDLVGFFGLFYTVTSLLAFLLQAALTQPLLERAGIGVALTGLPGSMAVSALAASVFPGITAQTLLRGTDVSLSASLHRSAYEPLFSPLPAARRRGAKVLIDVIVDKLGDALGGLMAWGLVLLLPHGASVGASILIVPLALTACYLARKVYRGYVEELASSLRAGETALGEFDKLDQATALHVSRTFAPMDRVRLLEEIRKLRESTAAGARSTPAREDEADSQDGARVATSDPHDPAATLALFRVIEGLLSDDLERVQRALKQAPQDVRIVPFLLPLVGRADCADAAMHALASFGDQICGQLGDALHRKELYSPAARRRFARVLSNVPSVRSALALLSALDDPDYYVRHQMAQGIALTQRAGIHLPVEAASWITHAKRELERDDALPITERLDCVFTLLGLAYDFESVHLARRAMSAGDAKLRGTALEYIENILPPALRAELFRALETEPPPVSRRAQHQLLAEMKRTLG